MRDGARAHPDFLRGGIAELSAWVILLAALYRVYVYISETLMAPGQGLWFFFSSDTVQYGLIYRDLFEDGFHFAGWNISHAPEYVQMITALLLRSMTRTLTAGHVLEALIQPILLALALRFTLSRLWPKAAALGPAVVAVVLTLIAHGRGADFIAFVWSNRHGFTAILAILALGLLIDVVGGASRTALLGLVVASGVASDMLFFVWFVAPAVLAALAASRFIEGGRWRRAALQVVGGALLGLTVFWLVTPASTVGSKLELQWGGTWHALNRIWDAVFWDWSSDQAAVSVVTIAGFLVVLATAIRSNEPGLRVAGLFVATMGVVTVLAVAATGAPFREAGFTRYLLAPELAGLVVLTRLVHLALGRWREAALPAALALAVLPGFRSLAPGIPSAAEYYPRLVSCLDDLAKRHRLEYGVADYWLAKYVTALSRSGLRVMAVTPRLDPFVNFTNIEWFLGGVGARRHDRPAYTFAILGARRPEEPGVSPVALSALGPPLAVETCEGFEVRVLPPGADERIRKQFRENRRIKEYYAQRGLALPADSR